MNKPTVDKTDDLQRRQRAPLATPNDLERGATADIAGALNAILADVFAMYLKTKNFHWHMSGRTSATTTSCLTSTPTSFTP